MPFKIFLLWSFFLLGRPQDLLTFLVPFRPALVLTVLTTFALLFSNQGRKLTNILSMPETKIYLLYFFIMIIGIPFAYHRRVAFESIFLGYLSNILFFLAFVTLVDSLKKLKTLLFVICLSVFLYSFFGLITGSFSGGRFFIYGGILDPNDIAYVLISMFPLCLIFIYFDERWFKKLFSIITVLLAITLVLLTGSRGGFLALGTVFLVMFLTKISGLGKTQKFLIFLILAGFYFLLEDKINLERYLSIFEIEEDYNISSESGRLQVWEYSIQLILNNPITGVGVECFPMAVGYLREALGLIPRWQFTHNSFLQVAVEVGLIGFIIFTIIILRTLSTFLHTSKIEATSTQAREISTLGGLMFLGFIGQLVAATFLTQGYSIYFVMYFALAATVNRLEMQNTASYNTSQTVKLVTK
jgi:putative inorganic carbon (hco3(-)) transporter